MRSVLTALGIIIGVGAVIAMVGIGNGAKAQVETQIASLGQNVILIFSGSTTSSGIRTGGGGAGTLKIEDAEAIRREVPGVIGVSEEVVSTTQVAAGNQNWFTRVYGESADYFDIRQWPLADGAPFTAQDVRSANKVCVIGRTTATQVYGNEDPVGQILRIKEVPFTIVGVLTPKGLSTQGVDQDDIVIMPYTSAMKRVLGGTILRNINVQIGDGQQVEAAQQQIISLLRQRHNIRPGRDDDFTVRNQQEIAEAATETSRVMTVLLGAIAGVSLVVGGHHEHHARERHRADTRDRCAYGRRCARQRHSHPVLNRSGNSQFRGRRDRYYLRHWRIQDSVDLRTLADADLDQFDRDCISVQRSGRRLFRILSRPQSRRARSHRSLALRIEI